MANAVVTSIRNVFGGDNNINPKKYTEGVVEEVKGIESLETDELLASLKDFDNTYQTYYTKSVLNMQKICTNYYLGIQGQYIIGDQNRFSCDNIIFQSVETYIPQATRKNPEPVVSAKDIILQDEMGNTTDHMEISKSLTIALNEIADSNGLVSESKQMMRDWLQKQIGVLEITYDLQKNKPVIRVIDPLAIELDHNGYVDNQGLFHGLYVRKICNTSAKELMELYPEHKDYITEKVGKQLGSSVTYSKYTTEQNVIVRFEDKILFIEGNPYKTDDETSKFVDSPFNYVFLTFFNDKRQPHDNTGLVWQVVPTQDKLNKVNEQIFDNVDQVNSSIRFDPDDGMTDAKASSIIRALRKAASYVMAKQGAIERIPPPVMGSEIFNLRNDLRNEIQSVFGVYGSMPSNIQNEKTVGGKVITRQLDESRIGGGITYQLEQVYDSVFNWCVQIMKLMMIEQQSFIYEGEQTTFSGQDISKPVIISVKENSMIPRDPINDQNLAIQMFQLGAISRKTLLEMTNFPNPQQAIDDRNAEMQPAMSQPGMTPQIQQQVPQDITTQPLQ